MRQSLKIILLSMSILVLNYTLAISQDMPIANNCARMNDEVKKVVSKKMKKKILSSGTLDIYDPGINSVRNLRKIKFYDEIKCENNIYTTSADYRDINTGEIVNVKVTIGEAEGSLKVKDITINGVKKVVAKQKMQQEQKEFTDKEIQDTMKEYFKKRSKFTGTFDIYDEENSKLRNLNFERIHEKVRRFESLFISSIDFKDINTDEEVMIDITVENNLGKLIVKKVKIKKVKKVENQDNQ